jgi:hypothetical protein
VPIFSLILPLFETEKAALTTIFFPGVDQEWNLHYCVET